ncbi:MAG: hypothetical protein RL748_754 [Pseudomonadota bacterium]|jgi:antitoxin PrlF
MSATLELESTLTDRYQTTIPEAVRRALKLDKRDKIRYAILPDGEVQLTRVTDGDDPLLGEFLTFLSKDMASHPEQIKVLDSGLKLVMDELSAGQVPDLDQALSPDDE